MTTNHTPWRCWGCGRDATPTKPCPCGATIAVYHTGIASVPTGRAIDWQGHNEQAIDAYMRRHHRYGILRGLWRWLARRP